MNTSALFLQRDDDADSLNVTHFREALSDQLGVEFGTVAVPLVEPGSLTVQVTQPVTAAHRLYVQVKGHNATDDLQAWLSPPVHN